MAADDPKKTNPFDPQALLEAQRRNVDAFMNASHIVADGMRAYAERHAAMVQEAMSSLWSELQASTREARPAGGPSEQLERMRAAFERVMAQVQELGNLLIKVQSEAIAVINECAAKNLQALGGAVPELAELQQRAKQAFEAASRQTNAALEEMRKRMASLEEETRKATAAATPATETAAAPGPAAAAATAAKETPGDGTSTARTRRSTPKKGGGKS